MLHASFRGRSTHGRNRRAGERFYRVFFAITSHGRFVTVRFSMFSDDIVIMVHGSAFYGRGILGHGLGVPTEFNSPELDNNTVKD